MRVRGVAAQYFLNKLREKRKPIDLAAKNLEKVTVSSGRDFFAQVEQEEGERETGKLAERVWLISLLS